VPSAYSQKYVQKSSILEKKEGREERFKGLEDAVWADWSVGQLRSWGSQFENSDNPDVRKKRAAVCLLELSARVCR